MNFLSISSHVVHGYVGNKAINMAIQFKPNVDNIDILNTIQLNTHPRYLLNDQYAGLAIVNYNADTLINEVLKESLLGFLDMEYNCIVLSYFNNAKGIDYLTDVLLNKKAENTKIILDPIMGDNGRIYCNPLIIESYKNLISTLDIDCILPNQFELELLVYGENGADKTKDNQYFIELINKFHTMYPKVKNLIVTSAMIDNKTPCILVSSLITKKISKINLENFYLKDTIIYGCGDLFTGLIAYEYTNNSEIDIVKIVSGVVQDLKAVIDRSVDSRIKVGESQYQLNDLNLIECIDDILSKSSGCQNSVSTFNIENLI